MDDERNSPTSVTPIPCPAAPDYRVDWDAIDHAYEWVRGMRDCPQDPIHHAEGDVWIHTRMVVEALAALPAWRALPGEEREIVFAAALLHDVSKPDCTREEMGRITSRGHSVRGAMRARSILWRMGVPLRARESICALVRHHQIPFYLIDREDRQRIAIEVSWRTRCDWLALVTEADARGRSCGDLNRLLDNISLFSEFCREEGCLDRPRAFPSEHSRFEYFRKPGRSPDHLAYDDTRCEVVMLSGMPGAGKDRWLSGFQEREGAGWPVISLDVLRQELDIEPGDPQSPVAAAADAAARVHLREGRSFVFNATNLSRQLRARWIDLFAAYRARVRIVYLEVPEDVLQRQNRERTARVPEKVLRLYERRWEVPDLTEAHRVDWLA